PLVDNDRRFGRTRLVGADRPLRPSRFSPTVAPGDRTLSSGSKGRFMTVLLGLSRAIDWMNGRIAVIANWLVLLACLISAGNAFSRYLISVSSNGWLEIQWYMFAGMVLLGAPYTLAKNEHVRVDLVYGMVSERTRIWIDIIGGLLFLLPICVILT